MAEACKVPNPDCRYFGTPQCILSEHHEFYPKKEYTSDLEKTFRSLPGNIVELRRCDHDTVHATNQPPEKPSTVSMVKAIVEARNPNHTSVRKRKAVERMLRYYGIS